MTTPAQVIATPAQMEQDIFSFKQEQQKNGRADETIRSRIQSLRQVSQLCDINNPEIIKLWLSDTKNENHFEKPCTWNNKTKTKFVDTYSAYLKYKQIQWTKPSYAITTKLPFIPTEQEIDLLISGSGKVLSAVLQCLKETGIRIGELTQLTPKDLDTERKTLNITPEKGSNPRILPITDKLIGMINNLPKTHKTIFQPHKDTLRDYLCTQRKQLAEKLNNPRLQKIGFHTLRHWKGTMLYHETKDLRHVQKILGHKQITSTVIYENTACALWLQETDNFMCKVAHNEQEETELIETGFQHVNNRGELAFYKKRK
jgi:integrase/recombinase XerD